MVTTTPVTHAAVSKAASSEADPLSASEEEVEDEDEEEEDPVTSSRILDESAPVSPSVSQPRYDVSQIFYSC